jgi:hypothetical protein
MKALFVTYNQALTDPVLALMDKLGIRGYTLFPLTHGRGQEGGEPHMGTHTWPAMNSSILAIVNDDKAAEALSAFRDLDHQMSLQGLRAFVWDISDSM